MRGTELRHGLQALGALAAIALAGTACGSSSPGPQLPTGPTSARLPVVTVSFPAVPLEAKPQESRSGMRTYEISATATLRESGGVPARLESMEVTFMSASNFTATARLALEVEIAEFATADVPVRQVFESATPVESGVWRLTGRGTSADGNPFSLTATEVPVMVRSAAPLSSPPVPAAADAIIAAAGDIGVCGSTGTEATARLLDRINGTVLTLGDNVYPVASAQNFQHCYEPTWGRHKMRTRPSPGNHDWQEAKDNGASYLAYFGLNAGPPGLGYYSFDLGTWHLISVNSDVPAGTGSAQYDWLRIELANNRSACTLAYWHHPVFSSGRNGPHRHMRDVFRLLHEHGVDVVLNGHDHSYERFAPQDADGRPTSRGIRQFIAGTGGAALYPRHTVAANSEVHDSTTWGVLKLTLKALGYDWEFVPGTGGSFRDSGSGACVY